MNQQEFIQRYETQWQDFERVINSIEAAGRKHKPKAEDLTDFPLRYRQLCQQLALARDRDYAAYIIDRLNKLVLSGHQFLYESRAGIWSNILQAAMHRFPRQVRRDARLFWLSVLLMFGPALGVGLAVVEQPDFIYTILEPAMVDEFEAMYDPDAERFGVDAKRASDDDFEMFGFYIRNNIGVGFRTFAGGLLFGIGAAVLLVFNGVYFGAVAGHVTVTGSGDPFWSFVVGHGAFELTAIVLAGMAGLKLGFSLIAPGRLSRSRALREAAKASMEVVYGMIVMLVLAAFVEAFWSSTTSLSSLTKYVVGACLWVLVAAYFLLLGRERGR